MTMVRCNSGFVTYMMQESAPLVEIARKPLLALAKRD